MTHQQPSATHTPRRLLALAAGTAAALTAVALPGTTAYATTASAPASATAGTTCHLGNGVQHVINLVFDNVHFARDNPDVPSDLEQMPHLLSFLTSNGTVMSNTHTPLIAHTADDSLSIYTGLYGDRHGQPLSNSYKTYNPDGTTDPAASFAYWTTKADDTKVPPTAGHDTAPTMVYSPSTPTGTDTTKQTPAPWVPFTRAGCTVGDFSTANMVLENAANDLPYIFGANSPEAQQNADDPDSFKDKEIADYIGVAVHCAKGAAVCANAQGVKYGQTSPTPTAAPDLLPTEPGGYTGYQALFGARYTAPQLGAGIPNLTRNGYPVTDASGNLVDLSGQPIIEPYSGEPGFPGFSPTPTQSLAYLADMQESGIPVTYGYISDMHERKAGTSNCTTATATGNGKPLGPGDSCYVSNAKAYDAAFATFFQRLAADGITKANTLFVISAEENDQFSGANVGRAVTPTPAGCDGVTTPCSYAANTVGELQANITSLLSTSASAGTAYDIEPQGASIYAHGQPSATDPTLRQLERDTAAMTATNTFSGVTGPIVKYQADAVEQRILHMQTADRLRTPSYTMFPVPDYYFSTTGPAVSVNTGFAWNHGYYSPNIDITWSSLVGPGVRAGGIDGPSPAQSNEAQDPNSTNTVPQASWKGTWVEEVDLRPTLLHLVGLTDDYPSDGEVISQILTRPSHAVVDTAGLAVAYQQIESSVGLLATTTLQADSRAMASGSSTDDRAFARTQAALTQIANRRDALAGDMKAVLAAADRGRSPNRSQEVSLLVRAAVLLWQANQLATH